MSEISLGLTPPSSGQLPAGFARLQLPLMSNVRPQMSSAFKVNESVCWGTAGSIEDVLSRAADLSIEMLGASDPISLFLVEERKMYWGGKVVVFQSSKVPLGRLAAVLNRAGEQALASGAFTEVGIAWLTGPFADFCQQVKLAGELNASK